MARPLDHLVLAVTDLATARRRLESLGFTVVPDASHPFGTGNACVFFEDGTYLEPLAVEDEPLCARNARAGNVFVARDRAFRFRSGPEGMEAMVFGTADADADHAAFVAAGFSGGPMLEFSRPVNMPDGAERIASFRLAFAGDWRSPDFHAFTCQRINTVFSTRSPLSVHENGVTGVRHVVLTAPGPAGLRDFLETLAGVESMETDEGLRLATAGATIQALTPQAFAEGFGGLAPEDDDRGLRGRAVVFAVRSLEAMAALFRRNGIDYGNHGGRLAVPPVAGQSVLFAFEEKA